MPRDFADAINDFTVTLERQSQAVFVGTVAEVKNSIQLGSPLTGAPGQPVDTGNLRASWQAEFTSPTSAVISTNVAYALENETGIRPDGGAYVQRSAVGGRWSVLQTRQNIQRILDSEVARLGGTG